MQTWRLVYTGFNNGFYNMAVDEAIAIAVREAKVPSTLRFYTWNPPCISIGYFQKPDDSLNGCIVRRITGGRAVFHGNDLSYSVVSRTDNALFPKNIIGTYSVIANALSTGLKHLGINPDPVDWGITRKDLSIKYHKTPLCFNTAIRNEITVCGKKLIGSAQKRWSDVFLQHGSLLVNGSTKENGPNSISLQELDLFSSQLQTSYHPEIISVSQMIQGPEILKQVQTSRADGSCGNDGESLLSKKADLLTTSLSNGFAEALGIRLTIDDLSCYELDLSDKLIVDKYSIL